MITVVKLKAEHLDLLDEQGATAYLKPYMNDSHLKALVDAPYTYTALYKDRVVLCAGVIEYWPGRGEGFAIFDKNCREIFSEIHYCVKAFLDSCPVKRVEAAVHVDFKAGHRWAKALGLKLEAPILRSYLPGGGDCSLYARVK